MDLVGNEDCMTGGVNERIHNWSKIHQKFKERFPGTNREEKSLEQRFHHYLYKNRNSEFTIFEDFCLQRVDMDRGDHNHINCLKNRLKRTLKPRREKLLQQEEERLTEETNTLTRMVGREVKRDLVKLLLEQRGPLRPKNWNEVSATLRELAEREQDVKKIWEKERRKELGKLDQRDKEAISTCLRAGWEWKHIESVIGKDISEEEREKFHRNELNSGSGSD